MTNFSYWVSVVLIFTLSILVILATRQVTTSPVQWDVLDSGAKVICQGERLEVTSQTNFNATGVYKMTRVVVNTDTKRTVSFLEGLGATVRLNGESIAMSTQTIDVGLLPPGNYQYRLGVESTGLQTSVLAISFSVVECLE